MVPTSDGLALVPWNGAPLTVGGELNKLAYNIALGRNGAGVHYRSDGSWGIKLGEQIALGVLRDMIGCRTEPFDGVTITRFDGKQVSICPNCIA